MLTWKKRPPRGDPSSQPRDHFSTSGWDLIFIARLINELTAIQTDQLAAEERMAEELARIPEEHQPSARNLLHYLALRSRDIRSLQEALASMGLSSLGRAESHVMHNILLLLKHLHHLVRHSWHTPLSGRTAITRHEGRRCLEGRATRLLGEKPQLRSTRIMVTMPQEAAEDYALVRDLVSGGMDSARINCAHDGPDVWAAILAHLDRAEKEIGRRCSILMDLGGPKIRTGPVAPGPRVLKWHPGRDEFGRPTTPARIWLTPSDRPEGPPEPADASLPLGRSWLSGIEAGDSLRFRDARGARRTLEVVGVVGSSRWAISRDTSYLEPGIPLVRVDRTGRKGEAEPLGEIPPLERGLELRKGDRLILTRAQEPGRPALPPSPEGSARPARISCTLPEALADVRVGEPVVFDDGKLDGRVIEVLPEGLGIEIVATAGPGPKLGADKGINFPASALGVPSLTDKDLVDLEFIVDHADMVGYSFVRTPADVHALSRRIESRARRPMGIVLKIETQAAFDNLPGLLLAALEAPSAGIMIARGDLAIECGYERLAELQEEILWLCEAAHLPVIWATQVLEHLAKDGQPSRAEVTDAAMGERAECVMLNKGPHVLDAVRSLDDIIRRMEAHQSKKTPLLRPLKVAGSVATRS